METYLYPELSNGEKYQVFPINNIRKDGCPYKNEYAFKDGYDKNNNRHIIIQWGSKITYKLSKEGKSSVGYMKRFLYESKIGISSTCLPYDYNCIWIYPESILNIEFPKKEKLKKTPSKVYKSKTSNYRMKIVHIFNGKKIKMVWTRSAAFTKGEVNEYGILNEWKYDYKRQYPESIQNKFVKPMQPY